MTALINAQGVVTPWPRKRDERALVLDYLASKFEAGSFYSEKEVNAVLQQHHSFGDWALLRRELFQSGRLDRDVRGDRYWLKISAD